MMNSVKEKCLVKLRFVCIKYRQMLLCEDVWQIDSLLGAVWYSYLSDKAALETDSKTSKYVSSEVRNPEFEKKRLALLEELRRVYEELEENGISKNEARDAIFDVCPISRITVNEDKTIALPDYGVSIKLTPLQFSLYLLFLSHNEGFRIKELATHKEELRLIMNRFFKNRQRLDSVLDSLIDVSNSSVYEQISRIRRAFVGVLGESKAVHYCICGSREGRYGISLCRDFVYYN